MWDVKAGQLPRGLTPGWRALRVTGPDGLS